MSGDRAIASIVVAGDGIVGLSAAAAFALALPSARITILATGADPAALADRLSSSLPPIGRFHAAVGLNEHELVRDGVATHLLGTRFDGWSASGESWFHCFGSYGARAGTVDFHRIWARARKAGSALPYHRYAAAAALAEAGKFVHPDQNPQSPLATYLYALRLDPERYRARMAEQCRSPRIDRIEGTPGGVDRREDGGIAALHLADGRRIEADLFVDGAGPSSPLLSMLDDRFEDWSDSLPCDRLLLATEKAGGLSSCDLAVADETGWHWSAQLPEGTLTGRAYASALTAPTCEEDAETVKLRPGRRPDAWVRNVLAIGDAAIAVDPLQGTNLHLAQSAILRALELLPGRDCHPLELREYNRRTAQETDRVRDFLALHYLRSGRSEGEFWQAAACGAVPDSLDRTLEQFERRGRLPFYEEETYDRHSWSAVLLGMGVLPRGTDAAAAGVDFAEAEAAMQRLAETVSALPGRLPAYRDYLARMRGSAVAR